MKKIVLLILFATLLSASERPLLTIYTYDSFTAEWGAGPKVKEAFEKAYQCRVKFVSTPSAIGTLRKIQLEGRRSRADILLGLDSATIPLAKKTGLFAKHGLETSGLQLPVPFEDDTFIPYDYNYFAFVYDSRNTPKVPHSLEALASMPDDFKIIIEDPRTSTIGFGLLLWVRMHYGDKAGDFWQRLSPHILTITKGWSEAYTLFLKGEADMVLSYTTSPAYHETQEHTTHIKAAHFKDGHYGQIEVAALLKQSKHKALARSFLRWMQGREFASIIPSTNWSYPVVPVPLPKAYEHLVRPKMLMMPQEKIGQGRKMFIREWLRAINR